MNWGRAEEIALTVYECKACHAQFSEEYDYPGDPLVGSPRARIREHFDQEHTLKWQRKFIRSVTLVEVADTDAPTDRREDKAAE